MTGPDQPWNIEVTSSALRGLNRLPGKIGAAIVEFITGGLAENPQRVSKPLVNELQGFRSARRGDYRILFTVDIETRTVYVHRIDHRADVYRPR
ncbi:type II toxin-antitoxin system RelE/ParE family toxin [Paenarthrobacter sp. Z7-10]|uniref:type II toxin-antitoxin system RelE family toxin n=1 Tax=Paenarthrobacter sp. Z7-10 TaxID=2787635 RepID=UPI0022A8E856|nr:type II toxin-antitoxin system RelE/ParE family toxin [Paenarthrobacter sp. Z7-10]MCZ2402015.1 type II toxin-antitoxin system RelE/ParE family toxin [Paenarthrobacter sp. Z7-10]